MIGLLVAAAALPLLALAWLIVSGNHGAAPTAPVAAAVSDQGIVNINGAVPGGFIAGTGMVLTSGGLVLTNNHVVADTMQLTAQLAGRGPIYDAIVLGVDPTQDVAVIQLEGASGLPTTPFDLSGSLGVGDRVTGLGNALGRDGAPVAAKGTVTSLDETIFVQDQEATIMETLDGVVCFNAPIQPGDSGGPLLNADGRVIGMDTAGSLNNTAAAGAKWGCAIPITRAMAIAQQIEVGHSVSLHRLRPSRDSRRCRGRQDGSHRVRGHGGHTRRGRRRGRARRRGRDHVGRGHPGHVDDGLHHRHAGPATRRRRHRDLARCARSTSLRSRDPQRRTACLNSAPVQVSLTWSIACSTAMRSAIGGCVSKR